MTWMKKPAISIRDKTSVKATHSRLGTYYFYFQPPKDRLFTENETNHGKDYPACPMQLPFVKDAFHDAIINGENLDKLRAKKDRDKIFAGL